MTGPSTAVEAMSYSKKAADAIDAYLMGKSRYQELSRKFEYGNIAPVKLSKDRKQHGKALAVTSRKKNFCEVSQGLSLGQALIETNRCLRCDVRN